MSGKAESERIIVPAILGPTAVGKTELALRLAGELGAEIISCDSRQIYRHMDIGTAKPTRQERRGVRHWLIDVRDPHERYSAYLFSRDALRIIRSRAARGKRVIICGGSGLYYRCLVEGMGPRVPSRPEFEEAYQKKIVEEGHRVIYRELEAVDAQTARRLHPHDVKRIIRALQVYYDTGMPLSRCVESSRPPAGIDFRTVIAARPRQQLYRRIEERVGLMVRAGLWDEFRALRERGYDEDAPGLQCLGYQELFAVEKGEVTLEEAASRISRNSRRYAKRQITWFTHQARGVTIDLSGEKKYYPLTRLLKAWCRR